MALRAGKNFLSGSLPESVSNLSNLTVVQLRFNSLTGTVPQSYQNLVEMQAFDISANFLTGSFPYDWIGDLVLLRALGFAHNTFTGTLPESLSSLEKNEAIVGLENNYTGSLPTLENCTSLRLINLRGNSLSGTVPTSWQNLVELGTCPK